MKPSLRRLRRILKWSGLFASILTLLLWLWSTAFKSPGQCLFDEGVLGCTVLVEDGIASLEMDWQPYSDAGVPYMIGVPPLWQEGWPRIRQTLTLPSIYGPEVTFS